MPPPAPRRATPRRDVSASRESASASLLDISRPLRREDGREVPLGARGAATRQRLIEAARTVFEEQGYGQSSVNQISERAGVSQGTYYQYFRDRSHVMAAIVDEFVAGLLSNTSMVWRVEEGRAGLTRMMRAYVFNYAENAAFARVWEEVSQTDASLADVRRRLTKLLENSIETQLNRGLKTKLLRRLESPAGIARALTSMADRFCYLTYAFDPAQPPMDPIAAADLLVDIWCRTLDLQ